MKLNENFVLRQIADTWVVLPLGAETLNFDGLLRLNSSGVLLWKALEAGADKDVLVQVLLNEYDVSAELAEADVKSFLEKLIRIGCIESE